MIDWINSWIQGIIIAVIISTIIEMILPEGKIRKYVQTIIGVYIVFIIISPIITKLTGKEISLSEYIMPEIVEYETTSIDTNAYIESAYIESIKNEIIKTIKEEGYTARRVEIQIDSTEGNYGNINWVQIILQKNEVVSNQIEPVKIDIQDDVKNEETIPKETIDGLKNVISEKYGTKIENITINE